MFVGRICSDDIPMKTATKSLPASWLLVVVVVGVVGQSAADLVAGAPRAL